MVFTHCTSAWRLAGSRAARAPLAHVVGASGSYDCLLPCRWQRRRWFAAIFLVWIPGIVMDIEYIKVRGSSMREGQPIHDTPLCAGRCLPGVAKACATLRSASVVCYLRKDASVGEDPSWFNVLFVLIFADKYCRHAYRQSLRVPTLSLLRHGKHLFWKPKLSGRTKGP